ncbi:MAG TPA: BRCT domain-containing protein [Planctomycetota bacterium]|nr:BRCT domain-containing protein [Planctomycetota bacterium]
MSTKQSIIFTFMVLFLAGMLFGLGAWFHFSSELANKAVILEKLTDRRTELNTALNGSTSRIGLKKVVDDPIEGLRKKVEEAAERANKLKGTAEDTSSLTYVEGEYEKKEGEIGTRLGPDKPVQAKWKSLYEEWAKLNGDIEGAVKKLKAQNAESEQKTAEAQTELQRELDTETTEKKKIVEDRKKNADELGGIRAAHEQVLDKISDVTRDTRKSDKIAPQGKLISAHDELKLVTIDRGRDHGVKKGMRFTVFSGHHAGLVKKALIEVTRVNPSSSDAILVPPNLINVQCPITGWIPTDPRMKYSVYTAGGQDENAAVELITPKTRQDRIEAYRLEKMEREFGKERVDEYKREKEEPSAPPVELGKGFVPLASGDWINNPDWVPIIPDTVYQKKTVDELLAMQDVNLSSLTFHITDSVRPYRKEFLKRLSERNRCKTSEGMSADVNYIVTAAGATRADLLEEKLASTKGKEEVTPEIKSLRKTLEALQEGKKIGVHVIAEDEMEAFFLRRQRKAELLRGKTVQPGRSTFYVAGETKERSVDQTRMFIRDHGGVPQTELDQNVDYVVVGAGLSAEFYENIKKMGVKIIREDELNHFFGLDK